MCCTNIRGWGSGGNREGVLGGWEGMGEKSAAKAPPESPQRLPTVAPTRRRIAPGSPPNRVFFDAISTDDGQECPPHREGARPERMADQVASPRRVFDTATVPN